MGIGRRDFLKYLAMTTSTIAFDAGSAVQVYGDLYLNRKLGIAFRCPAGWHFADVKEMGDVRDGQILAPESELLDFNVNEEPLPILTVTRDPLGSSSKLDHFTPGVTINLENLTESECNEFPMVDYSKFDVELCQQMFEKFELLFAPSGLTVSKCKSAEFTSSFLYKHKNIVPTLVRMRSVIVNHHPSYYTIRMFDSPFVGGNAEFNYDEFLSSFRLV